MMPENRHIFVERVRQLYSLEGVGLTATFVNSCIVAFILWPVTERDNIFLWLGGILALTLVRAVSLLYCRRFYPVDEAPGVVFRFSVAGIFLSGVAWGSLALLLFPAGEIMYQVFLCFVLGGMVVGAAASYSAFLSAFSAYAFPAILPMVVVLLLKDSEVQIAMASMLLLFLTLMIITCVRIRNMTVDSLHLRFNNLNLLEEVRSEKQKMEQVNVDLKEKIREREEAEEQLRSTLLELERSNRDLEQFAYVASHDLQEPLRTVASFTALLSRRYADKLDDNAREYIEYATDGANRMQSLINDLLEYSRVNRRGQPFQPVDMDQVLMQALDNLRDSIDRSGAAIEHEKLPCIYADGTQLIQVFQNIISNAIKFHGKEKPYVKVRAERKEGEWVFSIRDNGIGISPKFRDRVFVIFQRLHNREKYPGTGIGLALCKRIVERHNGRIWFESTVGEGTTFFLAIPDLEDCRSLPESETAADKD